MVRPKDHTLIGRLVLCLNIDMAAYRQGRALESPGEAGPSYAPLRVGTDLQPGTGTLVLKHRPNQPGTSTLVPRLQVARATTSPRLPISAAVGTCNDDGENIEWCEAGLVYSEPLLGSGHSATHRAIHIAGPHSTRYSDTEDWHAGASLQRSTMSPSFNAWVG